MMRLAVGLLAACGTSAPPMMSNHVPDAPSPAPDLAGLRQLLAPIDMMLDGGTRGCPDGKLRDYVASLVTNGSPHADGDIHRLQGGCGAFPRAPLPIDPPADPDYWFCTIDAYTSDPAGDSPWHYELHVRVRKADRRVDLATIACPGV